MGVIPTNNLLEYIILKLKTLNLEKKSCNTIMYKCILVRKKLRNLNIDFCFPSFVID